MASKQEILQEAKKLGDMLAEQDEIQKVRDAMDKLEKDQDAQQIMTQFSQLLQRLAQKEASGQPIEVDEKKQIQTLQTNMAHNLTLQQFQQAQMNYEDLMREVDQAVTGPATEKAGLGQTQQAAPGGAAPGGAAGAGPLGGGMGM